MQYNLENFTRSVNEWIEFNRKFIQFEDNYKNYYFEDFCGDANFEYYRNEDGVLSRTGFNIFPNIIFKKSNSIYCRCNQTMNNINLADKMPDVKKHFFFYSNFDAVELAPVFLDDIHNILETNFRKDSVTLFVLEHSMTKEELCTLKNYYNNESELIENFYILQQIDLKNTTTPIKTDTIFSKNSISFIDKAYTFTDTYYFQNIFFEISSFSMTEFYNIKVIEKNFCNYSICENSRFRFGDLKTKTNFYFDYCYVRGRLNSLYHSAKNEKENTYLLFLYDSFRYEFDSEYTLCISNEKFKKSNLKNGKIVSYNQLDNFENFVYGLFKKDIGFNEIFESYCITDKFLINNHIYPLSGILKNISIKDVNFTIFNFYKLLENTVNFKNISVLELDSQKSFCEFGSHKEYLIYLLENLHKTKKITNIESTDIHKNYAIDINVDKDVKIGVLIRKLNHINEITIFSDNVNQNIEIIISNNDDLALNATITDIFFNFSISIKYSDEDQTSMCTKDCFQKFINSSYMSQILKLLNKLNFQKNYYEDETDGNKKFKPEDNLQSGIKKIFDDFVSFNYKENEMHTFYDIKAKTLDAIKKIVKHIYESYKTYYKNNFSLELYYFENNNMDSYQVDFIEYLLTQNFKCEIKENIDLNNELQRKNL
ncbi:hypothetical protein GVAV_002255 [Gurleya vavrai]